jgi:hypothetical protein
MSFVHRIPDKRDTVTFFAFCFPFSYSECQEMLEKYDKQFEYCKDLNSQNWLALFQNTTLVLRLFFFIYYYSIEYLLF